MKMNSPARHVSEHPEYYINRELSLLEFNRRVLEQARNESVPLLERLRYLTISCSNLDEFFEVRVGGLKQKSELGVFTSGPDQLTPAELLAAISVRAHELVEEQYKALNQTLIPALEKEQIRFVRRDAFLENDAQTKWLKDYFDNELMPVISPLGLDLAHPFPRILNKSLNFIVELEGKDAFGRNTGCAVVQAPRALPRLIQLPQELKATGPNDYVFLSSVIHAFVDDLFPGMKVTGCFQFRVTRNTDLFVDEEEVQDLRRALEGELPHRQYGKGVRLEVASNCTESMWRFLLDQLQLTELDLYRCDGPVNLNRLSTICDLERPDLKFTPYTPNLPKKLEPGADLFRVIQDQDVLLHHPYESFGPVIDFLHQAATDPNVVAIRQTLYRTGAKSAIVDHLCAAARSGKEVTVVVELRARFDEADNISLAERLQQAGAHVVYGVVGHKAHAKMILITRREPEGLKHYCHLGTGNYHAVTARLYTDYGMFTADEKIGRDVHKVFITLTSLGKASKLDKILQSPFTLHPAVIEMIEAETELAKQGKPARIIAKMNSLVEPHTIDALYIASQAGVEIDLIVRGICCLRPGIKGISDNIRVRSIIGRFLEHPRIYSFGTASRQKLFLSSADWMDRNFFDRVEVAFPVEDKRLRKRINSELQLNLDDSEGAWMLSADGGYKRRASKNKSSCQATLMGNTG